LNRRKDLASFDKGLIFHSILLRLEGIGKEIK